jgi:hypothetical protein
MSKEKDMVIPEEPVGLPTPEELVFKYEEEIKKTHEYYNKELDRLGKENSMLSDAVQHYAKLAETYYKNVTELKDGLIIIHKLTEMLLNRNEQEPKEEK